MIDAIVACAADEQRAGWWKGKRGADDQRRHQDSVRVLAGDLDGADVSTEVATLTARLHKGWDAIEGVSGDPSAFQRYYAEWLKLLRVYEVTSDIARHQAVRSRYGLDVSPIEPAAQPTVQLGLV